LNLNEDSTDKEKENVQADKVNEITDNHDANPIPTSEKEEE